MPRSPPGQQLAEVLAGRQVGELIPLPGPQAIGGREFTHAVVERDFRTKSRAQLLRFLPGDALYISKFEDVRQELAVMRALERMNERWLRTGVQVCGLPVEVVTYSIVPLGAGAGLVEVVPRSWTLRELAQAFTSESRHLRVLRALNHDVSCLDRLAATTTGYLAAGYALGIRDSHDDNIMLRSDGALFRVDFGFIFGATPEIDAPQTVVPYAVTTALSASRWERVVKASGAALAALTGGAARSPPAWDCIREVAEMEPLLPTAFAYASTLSLEAFRQDVECAHEWSFSRAAKNGLREIIRYITEEEPKVPYPQEGGPQGDADLVQWVLPPYGYHQVVRGGLHMGADSYGGSSKGSPQRLAPDDPFAPDLPPLPPGDPFAPPAEERMEAHLDAADRRSGSDCTEPVALRRSAPRLPASRGTVGPDLVPQAQPGPLPPDDPFAARCSHRSTSDRAPALVKA